MDSKTNVTANTANAIANTKINTTDSRANVTANTRTYGKFKSKCDGKYRKCNGFEIWDLGNIGSAGYLPRIRLQTREIHAKDFNACCTP